MSGLRDAARRPPVVLAAGLALVAVALTATLSGSPVVVLATNGVPPEGYLAAADANAVACQAHEVVPRGTSAIRLALEAGVGPKVSVEVLADLKVLAAGVRGTGWYGSTVTVPVQPLSRALAGAEICFILSSLNGQVGLEGVRTPAAQAARTAEGPLPGRIRVEYLRAGSSSWLSQIPAVARRIGLGRTPSGTWIVLAIAALALAVAALASRTLLRELG
jgi:hypothetical protein